jgi:hypothetical protein
MTESQTWYLAAELLLHDFSRIVLTDDLLKRNNYLLDLHTLFIEKGLKANVSEN